LNYYVYYKIELSRLEEVRIAVEKLLADIERRCGVRGRWMRRRDDPATYMEVYEGVADENAFEDVLTQKTKDFPYPRKVERFQCA
jgi:hypothetical protein